MILLAKTSIKGEVTMWFTMYQNRERNRANTRTNKGNPPICKAQFLH